MKVEVTSLPDVKIIEPKLFGDARGFFMESYNRRKLAEAVGFDGELVQDNHSRSQGGVLRGLHYQIHHAQAKMVRVIRGCIFDVAVDMRKSSPQFGQWCGTEISEENRKILWVPEGFAHGFLVLSDVAEVVYKTSDYYTPDAERIVAWNDPDLAIAWPLQGNPILSERDQRGTPFRQAELFP
jgi:dTDP-4-dehydrorhamnose 3,5-epimerase